MRLPLVLALSLCGLAPGFAAAQSPAPPGPPSLGDEPDETIADGRAQRRLGAARRRWRRARVHNYRFELDRTCFCPSEGDVVIFVRNDRPLNAPASLRSVATVRRLHRVVQRAIDDRVHDLSVRYDRRGVPREISIDRFGGAADDEVAYGVERFWRGTRGRGGPDTPAPSALPAAR